MSSDETVQFLSCTPTTPPGPAIGVSGHFTIAAANRDEIHGEYKVLPEAPPATDATNASGTVVLHAVIGTDGRPRELSYVSGPQALVKAAIDCVTWWQYRINVVSFDPFEAQEVDTTISVSFPPS